MESKQRAVRYFKPQGATLDDMKEHARQHPLYQQGDLVLIWVNEGDLYGTPMTYVKDGNAT